ncbi:MAG: aspartate kinase, partial [Proteobacteria bacterium]|nr:aspartate kinase [Pseudomonadota bacterium]
VESKRKGNKVIVVVSAMGDTTNRLYKQAYKISNEPPKRELDMLVTAGERISMAMLSIAIQKRGEDSISFTGSQVGVITDNQHTNAHILNVLGDRVRVELGKDRIVIAAGFQGVSLNKEVTTLGRGGSDTSAVAIAAALNADICEMYKDVDGIYSIPPKYSMKPKLIDEIEYPEAITMAKYGADVVHYRACEIAAKFSLPIRVKSLNSQTGGTLIKDKANIESGFVKSVIVKNNTAYIRFGDNGSHGNRKKFFRLLKSFPVELLHISDVKKESGFDEFVLLSYYDKKDIENFGKELVKNTRANVKINGIKTVSLIGAGIMNKMDIINATYEIIGKEKGNTLYCFSGDMNITFVLGNGKIDGLVKRLAKKFGLENNETH